MMVVTIRTGEFSDQIHISTLMKCPAAACYLCMESSKLYTYSIAGVGDMTCAVIVVISTLVYKIASASRLLLTAFFNKLRGR